jgi:hypothetical protein
MISGSFGVSSVVDPALKVNCGSALTGLPGTVIVLTKDIGSRASPCPGPGLIIGSNALTLDCAGHTVWGITTQGHHVFWGIGTSSSKNVNLAKVINCKVHGFDHGFVQSFGSGNNFSDDQASQSTANGFDSDGSNGVFSRDVSVNNGAFGFDISYGTNTSFVSDRATGNLLAGFFTESGSGIKFTMDSALHNGDGFDILSHDVATRDNASLNSGDGFFIFGPSNQISFDRSWKNGNNGFEVSAGAKNLLSHDKAWDNDANGFITEHSGNKLSRDQGFSNLGYGFDDTTSGSGTGGTGNLYSKSICYANVAGQSSPSGLCGP